VAKSLAVTEGSQVRFSAEGAIFLKLMLRIKIENKESKELVWVTFKKISSRVLQKQRQNLYFQKKSK
jgi:hypothetical protein